MHMLAVLRELERRYQREIVIIGVHSAKFLAEKATANLRHAIRRMGVHHPVVSDKDFRVWQLYTVQAWPTLMFIDPEGSIIGKHVGEAPLTALDRLIGDLVGKYDAQGTLRREPLPWQRQEEEARAGLLYFPGKVLADADSSRLFIADTAHHRIVIAGMDGRAQDIVGGSQPGWLDGDFSTSRFNAPEGMALADQSLFVADTENHLIRRLDLETRTVETIAGTGEQAMTRTASGPARQTALNSPWDIATHQGTLYIAMAGLHQIWALDLAAQSLSVFAGTGYEGLREGPREAAWLAQPSGLALSGDRLYVADTEASAIRCIELGSRDGVRTTVGLGLFEFGDADGIGNAARLQHPLGLTVAEGMLFIADSYNNKIKRLSPGTREVTTFAGSGEAGHQDGPGRTARFYEPGGISAASGQLFVADTNNHAIRVINIATSQVRTMELRG